MAKNSRTRYCETYTPDDMASPESIQAKHHVKVVSQHLIGPDSAIDIELCLDLRALPVSRHPT